MAKMPPAFLKNVAAKKGAPGKGAAKLCPGCKNPACKGGAKCMKAK